MTPELSEICSVCEKPLKLCVCAGVEPVTHRIGVLILRHPQEQDRILGTARLAMLQLPGAVLKTGLSWANLGKALGRPADPKKWAVLYLGSAKTAVPLPNAPLVIVDKKGEAVSGQQDILESLEGIIALDGNWAQAKALWWRNAWLLKCRRLVLQPEKPSLYGALRKEPRRESVSTIESIALAVSKLENDQAMEEKILAPFRLLLSKAQTVPKSQF